MDSDTPPHDQTIALSLLTLGDLGWNERLAQEFAALADADLVPGRVVASGGTTNAMTDSGLTDVVIQRRSAREAADRTELPTVGDWVALEPVSTSPRQAALRAVLPRTSAFIRNRLSDGKPQALAANVDISFIVAGLDHDLNLRRIERYLVLAVDGDVTPVVVLNKMDIAIDFDRAVAEVHRIAAGTRVIATSAVTGAGIDEMSGMIPAGTTACLLGSSGVGKSSLTNALLGREAQAVRDLREDDSKGRHTTSHRELFALPGGGLLIDTPGLRTVGVLEDSDALSATFGEIDALARDCRFSDCSHHTEPGCAVRAALKAGTLSQDRYDSLQKLEAERQSVQLRSDERARRHADRQLGRFYRKTARDAAKYKRRDH